MTRVGWQAESAFHIVDRNQTLSVKPGRDHRRAINIKQMIAVATAPAQIAECRKLAKVYGSQIGQ
jgi:hypothetical protein